MVIILEKKAKNTKNFSLKDITKNNFQIISYLKKKNVISMILLWSR